MTLFSAVFAVCNIKKNKSLNQQKEGIMRETFARLLEYDTYMMEEANNG